MNTENISEKLKNLMRGKNYVPSTAHEIALELGLGRKDVLKLKNLLAGMSKNGEIARVKGDRYGALEELDLASGTIEFRPSGRAHMRMPDGTSVEFKPEDTGVALDGDKILARIIPVGRGRFGNARGAFGKRRKPDFKGDDGKKYARVVRFSNARHTKWWARSAARTTSGTSSQTTPNSSTTSSSPTRKNRESRPSPPRTTKSSCG